MAFKKRMTVDLIRSDWDKNKSRPEEGFYVFREKVYLKSTDYDDSDLRPKHVCIWNRYDKVNNFREFTEWQRDLNADAVTVEDPYWPEGIAPNSEGHYVHMDSILMKVPTERWIKKRRDDMARYDKGREQMDAQFNAQAQAASGGAVWTDQSEDSDDEDFGA